MESNTNNGTSILSVHIRGWNLNKVGFKSKSKCSNEKFRKVHEILYSFIKESSRIFIREPSKRMSTDFCLFVLSNYL